LTFTATFQRDRLAGHGLLQAGEIEVQDVGLGKCAVDGCGKRRAGRQLDVEVRRAGRRARLRERQAAGVGDDAGDQVGGDLRFAKGANRIRMERRRERRGAVVSRILR
jgi:hypothetical protein